MKNIAFVLLALCLAGCTHFEHVEFEGTVTGDKNGVFVINDHSGHAIYGANIKEGKFKMPAKVLEVPGYYSMKLTNESTSKKSTDGVFEVYLQDGKYTIKADATKPNDYPEITSSSPIQQELSAYYSIANKYNGDLNHQESQINARINDKASSLLPKDEFTALLNSASVVEGKKRAIASKILNEFVTKYPQNTIGAHIMLQLDYESDPVVFNTIYQKLNATVKSSDEGKEVGEKLGRLVKLIPGAKAPVINGKLLDGKPFDPLAMHKVIYLIDFWRATNDMSRRNHVELKSMLQDLGMHPQHLLPRDIYMKTDIPVAGCAHQAGTCRFGADPTTSVLDKNCKAHEVDNLYVVDTSFFVSIGAVNPSLTAIANAIRVGDHLLQRLR